jgi:hypothetical protein
MPDQALALERGDHAVAAYSDVTTRLTFASSPEQVWEGLMFYEQLEESPPFYLRWLLPVPIRTVGRKSEVGDEALCLYEGGNLTKRVTEIDAGRRYAFAVTEQNLDVGGGMRLSNGAYELRPLPGGGTEVTASTRYASARAPRWLWRWIEARVCHVFHRHILRSMRATIDAGPGRR